MNQHLKQAIAAARAGKKPQAKVLLARVIKDEPENVNAWFLLSSLADTEEQKIQHLEKVLELQPNHPAAAEQLADLGVTVPEAVEEALPDLEMPETAFEADSEPDPDFYPMPEVDLPPANVPDDPDEAMAWLERLAADQGAPLDELPTMAQSMDAAEDAAETTIEFPTTDYTEAETAPDDDFLFGDLSDSDLQESDVPEDPDDAMAWLERLAADQGAPMDELPSLFDSEGSAEPVAEVEDDFSWLDEEMAGDEEYLETTPTLLETEAAETEEEEAARTLHISNDYDFLSQSKADSIPAWLAGEEDFLGADTVIEGAPVEEEGEPPEPENLPDWLNETSGEGWVGDEGEKSGQVVWKAGQGDESLRPPPPGTKKEQETRKKSAARQSAAAGGSNLSLIFFILLAFALAAAILYILIFQPF